MYAWATPEKLLDEMTLDQIILYYREGWESRRLQARVFWGVLGEIMHGNETDENTVSNLAKFKESYPDGVSKNGVWRVSR